MKLIRCLILTGFLAVGASYALAQRAGYGNNDYQYRRGDSQNQQSDKGNHSRSGRVHYGTINNLQKQGNHQGPLHIDPAPSRQYLEDGVAAIRDRINRDRGVDDNNRNRDQDKDHDHDRDDSKTHFNFRVGYYHYHQSFRDDNFYYPYYVFDPYQVDRCVISPWYYYSFLPAYLEIDRLVYGPDYGATFLGFGYNYQSDPHYRYYNDDDSNNRYDDNYISHRALDNAVDDIVDAFLRQDRRAVDRLVPENGSVALGIDGQTHYDVKADDFYDMFTDVVLNSQTTGYQIVDVKASDDEAEVTARHDFLDPWGQTQTVYHRYHLFGERGNVVIRSFETGVHMYW